MLAPTAEALTALLRRHRFLDMPAPRRAFPTRSRASFMRDLAAVGPAGFGPDRPAISRSSSTTECVVSGRDRSPCGKEQGAAGAAGRGSARGLLR